MELGRQGGPGGCKGQRECDAYCSQPEHGEECFNFSKDNGLMPAEEIQKMERQRGVIKKLEQQGGGPGGCKGPEECRNYCMDTSHFDECAAFSVKEGIMDVNQAKDMMKEFVNIEERKFEQFGPPSGDFMPGQPGQPGQQNFGQERFNSSSGSGQKFEQRFEMFEKYRQEFKQRDEFCGKPENSEQCQGQKIGQPMPMGQPFMNGTGTMPFNNSRPPSEFPGHSGEFPGAPGEFPIPRDFKEGNNMFPGEMMRPPEGMMQQYPNSMMPDGGQAPMPGQAPTPGPMPGPMPGIESVPAMPPSSLGPQHFLGVILAPFLQIFR